VRDLAAARPWYERLLGEPAFFPHDREIVWTIAGERSIVVEEVPDRPGHGVVTVFVDDLDAWVAQIAARGLHPTGTETYANGVRKVVYRDADGNEVGFGGPP
jgi:catechol 2,3-dioxygenase-like lactoylglutathione lyase family enzyme